MTPSQIITADAQKHGVDPQRVLSYVAEQIQSNKANLLQTGESILLLVHLGQSAAECHLYTMDSPLGLRKSLAHFLEIIRQTPIKRLYGEAENPGILQMLQMIGLHVEHSDLPQFNWMANV